MQFFPAALQNLADQFARLPGVGSHFEANRGGLFSRQACRLYLEPFTLSETGKFLKHRNISWSRCSIADCHSFNQGLSGWNVSNVIEMDNMFYNCPIKEEYKPKFK